MIQQQFIKNIRQHVKRMTRFLRLNPEEIEDYEQEALLVVCQLLKDTPRASQEVVEEAIRKRLIDLEQKRHRRKKVELSMFPLLEEEKCLFIC